MDLMIFISAMVVAFFVNIIVSAVIQKRNERRSAVIHYLNTIMHSVLIEKHFDTEYWFDEHNHTFLAQGKNFDEISEILKSRFPGHIFLLDNGGFSEKTDWKYVPYEGHSTASFISGLIYGKAQ